MGREMINAEIEAIFDAYEAEQLKRVGMARAAAAQPDELQLAREIAEDLARKNNGLCDAGMVGKVLKSDFDIDTLGPAAGSIFREKDKWRCTGEWVKTTKVSSHSRVVRVWRLIG